MNEDVLKGPESLLALKILGIAHYFYNYDVILVPWSACLRSRLFCEW